MQLSSKCNDTASLQKSLLFKNYRKPHPFYEPAVLLTYRVKIKTIKIAKLKNKNKNIFSWSTTTESIRMELLTIFLGFLITSLVSLYFYLRRRHGSIEQLGIPMVKPFLCFGSPPFLHHKNLTHKYYEQVNSFENVLLIFFKKTIFTGD